MEIVIIHCKEVETVNQQIYTGTICDAKQNFELNAETYLKHTSSNTF